MAKIFLILIFSLLLCSNAFSQNGSNDTVPQKDETYWTRVSNIFWGNDTITKNGKRYKVSSIAGQISAGGAKFIYDGRTEGHFGNYWCPSMRFVHYYKNIFAGIDFLTAKIKIKDTLIFADKPLLNNEKFNISNTTMVVGYNFSLSNNFNVDPYIGILRTRFSLPFNYDDEESSTGYCFGISINKYVELGPKKYLGISVNGSINKSNYGTWNSDLGNSFYLIELALAYKLWILKKIK